MGLCLAVIPQWKESKMGVKDNRPLADFLPTLTIAAKICKTQTVLEYMVNQGSQIAFSCGS